jgi:hypothetical protein
MSSVNFSVFYDADQAREIAIGGGAPLGVVLTEINYIDEQIDITAAASGLSVTIVGTTTMTNSTPYFNAWNDVVTYSDSASQLYRLRMDAVIKFFSRLGYRVQRQRVGITDFFEWILSW